MRKILLGTNWKMHKTLQEGISYSKQLIELSKTASEDIEFFIIPPYTSLWPIKNTLEGSKIKLGAQNSHWEREGAYTGEVSPAMLAEIGIDIVELGHSERRQYYNENDIDINKKAHAVLEHGMRPLICMGENMQQKSYGIEVETLASQLKVCLAGIALEDSKKLIIAYEPVWAIGEKGIPADAEYVGHIHDNIRKILVEKYDETGKHIPILYGGSVNEKNSIEYLKLRNVNGLFIGRAAWNLTTFKKIIADVNDFIKVNV